MNSTVNGRIDNLDLAHDMARKEHARRAAAAGWNLVCRDQTPGTQRHSIDLDPEQPVLVDDALCYATGWEDNGLYEVRLGSVNGPHLHVKKLRAMTHANVGRFRAAYLADALAEALAAERKHSTDWKDHRQYGELGRLAERIVTGLITD